MKSAAVWELSWGLLSVIVVFVLASTARRTTAIGTLLVLVPFQLVSTRFATSSMLMAYTLACIFLMSGVLRLRMLPELGVLLFAYLTSAILTRDDRLLWQVVTVFQFVTCLVVFLLAYDFSRSVKSERSVVDVLLVTNMLVLLYLVLQIWAGPGSQFVPFGIEEFAFASNRDASDPRLVGPFGTPGNTAGYLTLMILLFVAELISATGSRRRILQIVLAVNLLGVVATGNRAAMLILMAMFPVMLYVFRRELGGRRVVQYALGGIVLLSIASVVAISFTRFGSMPDRLASVTETSDGVPKTRSQTWPVALEKIKRDPWFGQGPHFLTQEEGENMGLLRSQLDEFGQADTSYDPYPHSLYLYLLRTVGIVGLLAMMFFFFRAWQILYRSLDALSSNSAALSLVRAGLLVIPAFLAAQITLEFNRASSVDYAQFIFALIGLLIGVADRARLEGAPSTLGAAVPRSDSRLPEVQRFMVR